MTQGLAAGVDIVLEYNASEDPNSPSWVQVGAQTTGDFDGSSNLVDTTTKDDNGWASKQPTVNSWAMSVEGMLKRSDAGIIAFETAWRTKTRLNVRWRFKTGATGTFSGYAYLEGWKYSFPSDGMASFSGTLNGDGEMFIVNP